jgi:hypothetical protein
VTKLGIIEARWIIEFSLGGSAEGNMASGHVNRNQRPNHGSTDQACDLKISLANPEPSTHSTFTLHEHFANGSPSTQELCR